MKPNRMLKFIEEEERSRKIQQRMIRSAYAGDQLQTEPLPTRHAQDRIDFKSAERAEKRKQATRAYACLAIFGVLAALCYAAKVKSGAM